jgi:hypothetical protein
MRTITRPRIFVATGLLGIAALLGATAGVAPAVMGGGSQPGMQQEGTSAMQHESQPGMQNEVVLTGMTSDAQPGMQNE